MDTVPWTLPLVLQSLAFAFGVLAHNVVFKYGEWHIQATKVLACHVLMYAMLLLQNNVRQSPSYAFHNASTLALSYAAGMFTSVTIYRTLFHRLCGYPGPTLARVSKLWHVSKCLKSKNHILIEKLHEQYGDFVRTGPSELTVFHPDVFYAIYDGPNNPFSKPAWYDNLLPYAGLNLLRDKSAHDQRRRIWDYGFSTKAVQSYESHIVTYARQLDELIADRGGPVSINKYFYWFTWDVMGQLAFSESFGMLSNGRWHRVVHLLRRALELVGPFTPVPWLTRIAFDIPLLPTVRSFLAMERWCARRMDDRIKRGAKGNDVSSYLIDWSVQRNRLAQDLNSLHGDAIALVIAGSDTVAYTLVLILYHLAKDPVHVTKIREELQDKDIDDFQHLQELAYLNGVIKEALRLYPAVPTGALRETPPEGAEIGGRCVPGNVVICAPRWTIGRLESCFERPLDFVPERWSSRPEMIRNRKAFAPFVLGAHTCIGKYLAYKEMQYVVALLVSRYDIRLADGENHERVMDDMVDQFTAAAGELVLTFEKRKKDE